MPPTYDCKLVGDEVFVRSNYSVDKHDYMRIAFKRTVRAPDRKAGVVHPNDVPSDLGNLPLYRVGDYVDTQPSQVQRKDGLLLPMGRGEGMWIQFTSVEPYAVKIYFDGVNAMSGKPGLATADEATGNRAGSGQMAGNGRPVQDYIVVPGQKGFEGFNISADEPVQATATSDPGLLSSTDNDAEACSQTIRLDIVPSTHFKKGTMPVSVCFHGENTVELLIDPAGKVRDFFRRMATVGFCAETHMVYSSCKRIDIEDHFDLPLSTFDVQEHDTFEVFTKPIDDKPSSDEPTAPAATLGTRPNLVRDYLSASEWNKHAAITLTIELLSSDKFRGLTRRDETTAAATQITADGYDPRRLPFLLSAYKGPSGGSMDNPSGLSLAERIDRRHTWTAAYWGRAGSLIDPRGPDPSSFRPISEADANPYS